MKGRLWVIGVGTMGRDVGLFFLGRCWSITWFSRDVGRRDKMERRARRMVESVVADGGSAGDFHVRDYGDWAGDLPDAVFECLEEDLGVKRSAYESIRSVIARDIPYMTVSSSFLPGSIGPDCLGAHFIQPLMLTNLVEFIATKWPLAPEGSLARGILEHENLDVIDQTSWSAFALNRLLLPLQNECFAALAAGRDPVEVNASSSHIVAGGVLAMIDAIGIGTVAGAASRYVAGMSGDQAVVYGALVEGLQRLLSAGFRGKRTGDGILSGRPMAVVQGMSESKNALLDGPDGDFETHFTRRLNLLARNTLSRFVVDGLMTLSDARLASVTLFGQDMTLGGAFLSTDERLELAKIYEKTGIDYFRPVLGDNWVPDDED